MTLFEYVIFFFGVGLQLLLFWRAFRCTLWPRYSLFFIYLSYTTLWTVASLVLQFHPSRAYAKVYWSSEMVASVFRFAVTWEIYRQVFPRGTRVRSIVGTVLGTALITLAVLFYAGGHSATDSLVADFMRKMALSTATWIVLVLGLAQYYGMRIGRNIWGMAIGLLLFVSCEIANLSAFALSPAFAPIWRFVRPFGYVIMLLIWVTALWNYNPNPAIVAPNETVGLNALSAWRLRWANVDSAIRKVLKP
jgi:hypothetical protein